MDNEAHHKPKSYSEAGVSIDKGDEAVLRYGPLASATYNDNVISGIGGFAALYRFNQSDYDDPVLVSATDGVGTKLELAKLANSYESIGYDLVAMVLDDLACTGAKPLFMLDYLSVGRLDPSVVERLVGGIAQAAAACDCVLIGGETAEHPGSMAPDSLDVAGFAVGVVDRADMWGAHRVVSGDVLIGLASPNARSNGFSLIRATFAERLRNLDSSPAWPGEPRSLIEALLEPSVLYGPFLSDQDLRREIHAAAHVTGGGLLANLSRVIPDGLVAEVQRYCWPIPAVFNAIAEEGDIAWEEMDRVFNLGIGMVLVVSGSTSEKAMRRLSELGVDATLLGTVVTQDNASIAGGARWK